MQHGFHFGMRFQPVRHAQRVAVVFFHADGEGADAAQHQGTVGGRLHGTECVLEISYALREVNPPDDGGASHHIRMAVDVFRC